MIPYASTNRQYRYLLTLIDVYSRYARARPLRAEVVRAMQSIYGVSHRTPRYLQTDQGREFFNRPFQQFVRGNGIHHYATHSVMKACVVERFNRTLKGRMWREFTVQGTHKWLHLLPRLLDAYNNTVHRSIRMRPNEVGAHTRIPQIVACDPAGRRRQVRALRVGDTVRVSKVKRHFAKGYTPNWRTELFTVHSVQQTSPLTYLLRDYQQHNIAGAFYAEELQRTRYPDDYLVERILRRKGRRVLVK